VPVSKNYKTMPDNWLELQNFALLKCRIQLVEKRNFGLYNKDGERVCIWFVKDYHTPDMIRYFSRPIFYDSSKKIFGDIVHLSTTNGETCEKLSNAYRFDNLVIFDAFGPYLAQASKDASESTVPQSESAEVEQEPRYVVKGGTAISTAREIRELSRERQIAETLDIGLGSVNRALQQTAIINHQTSPQLTQQPYLSC
jgi:hypothetical protein